MVYARDILEWDNMVSDARSWPELNGESATNGKTIVYTREERVSCTGDGGHPMVYYSVPENGHVVCGYCDVVYKRASDDYVPSSFVLSQGS